MFGAVVSLITSFGFLCLIRYIALYRSETVKKLSKLSPYNVGVFVKRYRNKNINVQFKKSPEKKNTTKQEDIENQALPVSPVIGDNILTGANVFHQYMCIDDHIYEGISRMSGEHVDNFSDLSSKLGNYTHDSNGLKGTLNKVKGHIAENHVAEHFEEAGIKVDWPETSNQEGWSLLKEALKEFEKQREILQQEILKIEKKYEHLFNEDKKREQDNLDQIRFEIKNRINEETKNLRLWIVEKEKSSEKSKTHFLENISDEIIFMRDQLELSWTDYFWPSKEVITHQRKLNTIVRFRSQFVNKKFKDRGFLLQWLAERGLCREVVFSEITKVEEERENRENHLIENIKKEQKELLDQRFKSVKELSDKFKEYIEQIRLDLSSDTMRVKKCQNLVKKESRKLKKAA